MNHEELNLKIAKCYSESEDFRNEYKAAMEEKNKALDEVKKNYIPNCKGYKIKEEQIEGAFAQKVADLCSAAAGAEVKKA